MRLVERHLQELEDIVAEPDRVLLAHGGDLHNQHEDIQQDHLLLQHGEARVQQEDHPVGEDQHLPVPHEDFGGDGGQEQLDRPQPNVVDREQEEFGEYLRLPVPHEDFAADVVDPAQEEFGEYRHLPVPPEDFAGDVVDREQQEFGEYLGPQAG